MTLVQGDRLAHYEIDGPLGAGGMGEVFLARDTRLNREVAVKVLPAQLARDTDALARFEQEAQVVASLSHPNILAIHDFGTQNEITYAVMELLRGENLRVRMESVNLSPRKVVGLALQIARGLAAAHARGVVHRDLKPENIFVTTDGLVKILDFGLAKRHPIASVGSNETEIPTIGQTAVGTVAGTLAYMSPEQLRGADIDHRSDIFSFGSLLYEMLGGARPFTGDSAPELMGAILRDDPVALSDSAVFVSPGLQRILLRCLEKRPDERFQSARDLGFALEAMSDVGQEATSGSGVSSTFATVDEGDGKPSSIAVLPFSNMSSDPEQEFFCEGMAEEIINALSRIDDLRVAARASAFQFHGKAKDIREVGKKLDVQTVLDGSVRTAGKRLRVMVQLVDVDNGYQIWSDRYDRELEDVFAIQDEISESIVGALELTFGAVERREAGSRHSQSLTAYRLYLKGQHNWYKREAESLQKSVHFFEQAVEEDPSYALAWAAISNAYVSLSYYFSDPDVVIEKAGLAIDRATAIDESLPEVQAAIGLREVFMGWDWQRAEQALLKAIEGNPSLVLAHCWYSFMLHSVGRWDEAIAEGRKSLEIDPLSSYAQTALGLALLVAGREDEAIAVLEDARESDADFLYMLWVLGGAYGKTGRHGEAVTTLERATMLSDRGTYYVSWLGWAYGLAGRTEDAKAILDELARRADSEYIAPLGVAQVFAGLGDIGKGLEYWSKALEKRNGAAVLLSNLSLTALRSESDGQDLLNRVGISVPTA